MPPRSDLHPYLAAIPGREASRPPRVLAHRGLVAAAAAVVDAAAAGAAPAAENTRAAFAAAETAGALYLESDCRVTADGEVVLFHDAELRRVTGDPRRVAELSLRELSDIMAGRGGLLTLEQALDEFPHARFNIDVKAAEAADPAGRIVAPHAHRVLLTSFSDDYRLRALRSAGAAGGLPATSPGQRGIAGLLAAVASRSRRLEGRALAGLDALQIPERQGPIRVLGPRLLDAAHRAGVEVHVWTVNDPQRMLQLVSGGVDGVVTDRADLALAALG
ncbi:glycerophosphodiester phosphodiesterase family protein [Leucobacter chironomi]|uniref:glycerophosphodiester phosphodiesterase family protein n=1 Tax=Leucobacter chironomi TaxID=491918 RepID=UPI000400CC4B|nr:glycerophosphodiester phosphodiesterase family protein [Leucobacter chironomi]